MVDTLAYREELRPRLPRWYRGWPHFAVTNLMLGGAAAALLARVHALHASDLLAVPLAFLLSNFVEYAIHRGPLHKPMGPLRYIHKAHGIQHHRFFTGDSPAHMSTPDAHDFAVLLFGPHSQLALLGGVGAPLTLAIAGLWGHAPAMLFGATATLYFLLYEWLHLAYHLPETNPLSRLPGIARLREHHRVHHELRLMTHWNFNITFPIFDAVFGTTWHPASQAAPLPAVPPPSAANPR